jgi:hypothetical protein
MHAPQSSKVAGGVIRVDSQADDGTSTEDDTLHVPKALHAGYLHIGPMRMACAVLPPDRLVLSRRHVSQVLGGIGHASLNVSAQGQGPSFLGLPLLSAFMSRRLVVLASRPLPYQHYSNRMSGLDAALLPRICAAWIEARDAGVLDRIHARIVENAEMLLRELREKDIAQRVLEACGCTGGDDLAVLHHALDSHLRPELAVWARSFPENFYRRLFRLHGLPYEPGRLRRVEFIASSTETLVFERVPLQVLQRLCESLREPRRGQRHLEFDSPHYGAPELRSHVLNLMFLMDGSGRDSWSRFQIMLNRAAPRLHSGGSAIE